MGGTNVLLLDEGTALALVGIVAIVAVCAVALAMVGLVLVFLARKPKRAASTPPGLLRASAPRMQLGRPRAARPHQGGVEIDVPTQHADEIIVALRDAGWLVQETGEVVATDDDEEALTTLAVGLPSSKRVSSGEEVH